MNFVKSLFYVYVMPMQNSKENEFVSYFPPLLKNVFLFSSSQTISKSKFRSVFSSYNHILK